MINPSEYKARRDRLMDAFEDEACVIYLGAGPAAKEGERFVPDSFFYYLTGIAEPGISMMLDPAERKFVLFAPEPSLQAAVWWGPMPSHAELKRRHGADAVYSPDEVKDVVSRTRASVHSIRDLNAPFTRFRHARLRHVLTEARLRKSAAELKEIGKSVDITAEALKQTMENVTPGKREGELQALINYTYQRSGAVASFPPIATMNGAVLHEVGNDRPLKKNRLLLMDSGASFEYASDISRTWPVSGKFSGVQKRLYEIVLKAKNDTIDMIAPGVKFGAVHARSVEIITEGLKDEGILKGEVGSIIENGAYRLFYPHGLGHTLGLPGDAELVRTKGLSLRQGMPEGYVTTVEPGIYFNVLLEAPEAYGKHKDFIHLEKARKLMKTVSGIRLEDDVAVTRTGHEVLGPPIPETVGEIEAILGG